MQESGRSLQGIVDCSVHCLPNLVKRFETHSLSLSIESRSTRGPAPPPQVHLTLQGERESGREGGREGEGAYTLLPLQSSARILNS